MRVCLLCQTPMICSLDMKLQCLMGDSRFRCRDPHNLHSDCPTGIRRAVNRKPVDTLAAADKRWLTKGLLAKYRTSFD
jgi:hypothetical protein